MQAGSPTACPVTAAECYMAPMEIRQASTHSALPEAAGRQDVQLKNKIAQLLMEAGVSYGKEAASARIFPPGSTREPGDRPSLWPLLSSAREMIERTQKTERAAVRSKPTHCSRRRSSG